MGRIIWCCAPLLGGIKQDCYCSKKGIRMSREILEQVEREGYFEKARQGDHRACGLFARLVAYRLNPTGSPTGWGALRKTAGGQNVEGYSEDAIVLGNDPANKRNVVDIIGGAGAPGARINYNLSSFVSRRDSDIWEKPVPLNEEQEQYLLGATPPPAPSPVPSECKFIPSPCKASECKFVPHDDSDLKAKIAHLTALVENLSDRLADGLEGEASARWIGTVKFKVQG